MEQKYLLVCDDCDVRESVILYEKLGTKDELKKFMLLEFSTAVNTYAVVFADSVVEWDEASYNGNEGIAGMWVDGSSQYNRHINWWMVPIDGPYALVRCDVKDGGGIEVKQVGSYETENEAVDALFRAYKEEIEHPVFYAGWDEEYCHIGQGVAELTVETRDAQVNFNVICTAVTKLYDSIEYLG